MHVAGADSDVGVGAVPLTPRVRMSRTASGAHIAFVATTTGYSGTERVVEALIRGALSRGWSVSLAVPADDALASFHGAMRALGCQTVELRPVNSVLALVINPVRLALHFRATSPTVVHFHVPFYRWALTSVFAVVARRGAWIVRTEHNPLMAPPPIFQRLVLRLSDRLVDRFTYVSDGNRQRFERLLPGRRSRGVVVWNLVDVDRFHPPVADPPGSTSIADVPIAPGERVAVFVGSYGGRRSLRVVFDALARVVGHDAPDQQRWRLLVVGSGPESERALAEQAGVGDRVHFVGHRRDVDAIVRSCDVMVSASDFEGMSLAYLEAWASGLPVICGEVDGVVDIVGQDAMPDVCVPPDDAAALAELWVRVGRRDPGIAATTTRATAVVRTACTEHEIVQRYHDVYAEGATAPPPRSPAARPGDPALRGR